MTKQELVALIKEHCGPMVADAVSAAVSAQIAPLKQAQGEWLEKIFGDRPPAPAPQTLEDRSLRFGRIIRAGAASAMALRAGNIIRPEEFLKQWGDVKLADDLAAARTKAMAAGDATAGGFLVPPTYSQDVIEFLRAQSVIRRLGARAIPVPTGTVKIPKLSGGATAYYVGENVNATKSELTTGQLTLSFKKLVTLVPVSNDLIRYSSPGADAIVRDDTVNAMRVREDSAFIRDAGTESTPKGLRFWAHPDHVVAANGTASVQNTFTDLGKLLQKLLDANIPMIAPAWIFAPRTYLYLMTLLNSNGIPVFREELSTGKLWGYPYGVTTNVPANLGSGANQSEIYLTDMAQVVIGDALNLVVDASQEAAYYDGSTVVAAYSQDQTVVRAIAEHDIGVRYDKAIAVLTEVVWKPGSV